MEFINKEIDKLKEFLKHQDDILIDNENLTKFERKHIFTKTIEVRARLAVLIWVLKSKEHDDLLIQSTSVETKTWQENEILKAFDDWLDSNDDSIQFKEYLNGKS